MSRHRSRKDSLLVILAALFIFSWSGCGGSSTGPSYFFDIGENNPDLIVAFGDSITYGRDSTAGGYPPVLQQLLLFDRPNIIVANEGIPGTTTIEGNQRVAQVLEDYQPAILLIMYGTNDEYYKYPKKKSLTYNNLLYMVNSARERNTIPVIATLPPACGMHDFMSEDVEALNEWIRRLARNEEVTLAEVDEAFSQWGGCALINSGGIHPTDQGYNLIARTFFEALDKVKW
jgi:lysophospholipase L1-like esterase